MIRLSLNIVSIIIAAVSLCATKIPIRFIQVVGRFVLICSMITAFFSSCYLTSYYEWKSEIYPDAREHVSHYSLFEAEGIASSGVYVIDSGDAYLIRRYVPDTIRRTGSIMTLRLDKATTVIRYDDSAECPYYCEYRFLRKYYCPDPEMLQLCLLRFNEPCDYLIRKDPDGEVKYEIVVSDASMVAVLPAGSE